MAEQRAAPRMGAAREGSGGSDTVGTTAAPLAANTRSTAVLVQCDPDSDDDLYVGFASVQPIHLEPGDPVTLPVTNANLIYVRAESGTASYNWLALYGS